MKLNYATIEKRGGAAIVRFDRKQNLNAFNEKLVVELTEIAKSFHDDIDTQVVILSGARNAFSAGFDLKANVAEIRAARVTPKYVKTDKVFAAHVADRWLTSSVGVH